MNALFLIVLGVGVLLPLVLLRGLRLHSMLPLVFVQLLLGMALGHEEVQAHLRHGGIDLSEGPLLEALRGIGTLGLCLLVGLGGGEAVARLDRTSRWRWVPISLIGFTLALLGGSAFGALLAAAQPQLMGHGAGTEAGTLRFAFAVGVAMAVTALPVLLALLAQLNIAASPLGQLAAGTAALDELWLWLALGVLLMPSAQGLGLALVLLAAWFGVLALIVRPLLNAVLTSSAAPTLGQGERLAIGTATLLLSAAVTQALGLHAALGAFMAGALLPRAAFQGWREPALAFAQHLLLPIFFIVSGMALRVDAGDAAFWALAGVVSVAGIGIKFTASTLAARLSGLPWREARSIGSLLQCKGLMELVAVALMLQAGLLAPALGGALAVMALASTLVTPPLWRATRGGAMATPVPARKASVTQV